MRISIKAKLAGGFGIVLVLTGLAGGVGYRRLIAADEAMRFVVERSEVQNHVLAAKALAIRAVSNTRATVISTSDELMAQYAKRASDYQAEALAERGKARPLLLNFDTWSAAADKNLALVETGASVQATVLWATATPATPSSSAPPEGDPRGRV